MQSIIMAGKLELVTKTIVHHNSDRESFRGNFREALDLNQFISAEQLFPSHLSDFDQQLVLKVAREMKLTLSEAHRLSELAKDQFCSQYFDQTSDAIDAINLSPKRAFDLLLDSNIRLIVAAMSSFQDIGIPKGDLLVSGQIGLLTALKKFDFAAHAAISTYARFWIRREIWLTIVKEARTVNIPVNYHPFTRSFIHFRDQGLDFEATLSSWKHIKQLGLLSENEFRWLSNGTDQQKQTILSKARENWRVLAVNSQLQISLDVVLSPSSTGETIGAQLVDESIKNNPESVITADADMARREKIVDILYQYLYVIHVWAVVLLYFSGEELDYRKVEERLGYKEGAGPAIISSIFEKLRTLPELRELCP